MSYRSECTLNQKTECCTLLPRASNEPNIHAPAAPSCPEASPPHLAPAPCPWTIAGLQPQHQPPSPMQSEHAGKTTCFSKYRKYAGKGPRLWVVNQGNPFFRTQWQIRRAATCSCPRLKIALRWLPSPATPPPNARPFP